MSNTRPSYEPPSSLHPPIDVHLRSLAPLQAPPLPLALPLIPSPLRKSSFTPSYTLTTHLVSAAYPRAPSLPLPRSQYADKPGESKEERSSRLESLGHHLLARNVAYVKGEVTKVRGEVLWNTVNRFVRKDTGNKEGAVTLFLVHANGYPKKTWEPSLLRIFSRAEASNIIIDEVWAFESVQHGDSATINDNAIGDIFDYSDNARDILNILLYYLPSSPESIPLPTHLPRLGEDVALHRQVSGFTSRTLVGLGHSMGGGGILRAALAYPVLFASIIPVDPIIFPPWGEIPNLVLSAVRRRAKWRSREEALVGFKKSPFFAAWHPEVLEKYVEHGLEPDPEANSKEAVRLKMSGAQEATAFMDGRTGFETWQLLPQLDERVELRFIMNGKDTYATGGERATRELVWRRARNVSNVRMPSVGHLIPQEAPGEFAEEVVKFLKRKYAPGQMEKARL